MSDFAPAKGPGGRPVRRPVSQRVVLSAPQRAGYVRRWVNDTEGRIKIFEEGGWRPVANEAGLETADKSRLAESSLGSVVTRHVGNNMKSVLMEIKQEYFSEDQAKKAESIKASERDILTRRSDGQYGKIEVER
jgi:hypothetical protein